MIMKTSTMIWLGAAAVAGYYLAKRSQAATSGQASQAVTSFAAPQPPQPTVVVVEPDYDYGPQWNWGWGPGWSTLGRGGHHHHGGGGHRGGRH